MNRRWIAAFGLVVGIPGVTDLVTVDERAHLTRPVPAVAVEPPSLVVADDRLEIDALPVPAVVAGLAGHPGPYAG